MDKRIRAGLRGIIPGELKTLLGITLKNVSYFGIRYKCPFCKHHLRTFLPFGFNFPVLKKMKVVGGGYRENAKCPFCGSLDRERLLYLYLLRKTDIMSMPVKLLHVAPEARLSEVLRVKNNIDHLSADISGKNVMVRMDITSIQFPEDFFDIIICNHVLEHVSDDEKAMSELYRVLKPGGWAILQVPISLSLNETYEDPSIKTIEDREKFFGQGDHVRIYAEDYKDRLTMAGFKVEVFKWTDKPKDFGGRWNYFGLNSQESLYFARK